MDYDKKIISKKALFTFKQEKPIKEKISKDNSSKFNINPFNEK